MFKYCAQTVSYLILIFSETAQESGIEKQLRLIAESSLKQDESDEDDMLEDEENYATELDLVNGSYGREIRDMFQQIEDPEERARLRRARRAHMQRKQFSIS